MYPNTLYIIGNGFDSHHHCPSSYYDFRGFLMRTDRLLLRNLELLFGPRSLYNTYDSTLELLMSLEPITYAKFSSYFNLPLPKARWAKNTLWKNFEENLSSFSYEKVSDLMDFSLPVCNTDDYEFSGSDYFGTFGKIEEMVHNLTFDLKYRLHKWIKTLQYPHGFKKLMLPLDKNSVFLNFNYTTFLEEHYGVPHSQICYIHGCKNDQYGSLIIGHCEDPSSNLEKWIHKNKNKKRFRPNLKNSRGNYFPNYRLAYLAYLLGEDEESVKVLNGNYITDTRCYAVERLNKPFFKYLEISNKNTAAIIKEHDSFFRCLNNVRNVHVLGHSLSNVDFPYFAKIASVAKPDVNWQFSYYSENDKKSISSIVKRLNIDAGRFSSFQL